MSPDRDSFFSDIARELGGASIDVSPEARRRYGENTMPGGTRDVAGVVFPKSTADVLMIVRAANQHRVPIYPISAGNNIGLGSRSPVTDGQVVVDLGWHMSRIIEVNEELGFAVIEPGVSFQSLHDELVRLGDHLMISATSGPALGSVLGNALDKGGGYGPHFDHFGMLCGLEVVLGNGEVLRTGEGSLRHDTLVNWHVSRYSFGPILDGLFAQSNFGIVTRAAVWLLPRPPAIESFHFIFPQDDDLGAIIDLIRPLRLSGFVPTLFRVCNDLYAVGTEETHPEYETLGRAAVSVAARTALRDKHGLGAWQVSGAFYGLSSAALAPLVERVKNHFGRAGRARFVPHAEALEIAPLSIAIDSMSGRPSNAELTLLRWRPGGGNLWFSPGTPMSGRSALELDRLGRSIYAEAGMDYIVMHVAGARYARSLHVLVFNRNDPDENQRADDCYRRLAREFAGHGIGVGRAPIDYQHEHMSLLTSTFKETSHSIKRVLDPNGIIAPGRYGIG
jgi:4-cresol dehydrogenase (hydroxylating) flavoprotein subunit